MGYAELLIHQRLQTFPLEKQAEVYDFVEFLASRYPRPVAQGDGQRKQQVLEALQAARSAWPRMNEEQVACVAKDARGEWDGRGWGAPR